jgi:glutaredoxin
MEIIIYTTPGCTWCSRTKELFARAEVEYEERQLGTSEWDAAEFSATYPDAKSYPYVIIDGTPVGGLVDTAKLFLERGLVTAPNKNA